MKFIITGLMLLSTSAFADQYFTCHQQADGSPDLTLRINSYQAILEDIVLSNFLPIKDGDTSRSYGTAGGTYYELTVPVTMLSGNNGEADLVVQDMNGISRDYTYECQK